MKNLLITLSSITIVAGILFSSCKKDNKTKVTVGEFTVEDINANGTSLGTNTTYKGMCIAVLSYNCNKTINNDVTIAHNNGSNAVVIFNMPSASSGVYTIPDGITNFNSLVGTCSLYMMVDIGDDHYLGTSGTLTKTGARSFTFAIRMNSFGGKTPRLIAGNGEY